MTVADMEEFVITRADTVKVYVVYSGEAHEKYIEGVFSTFELAIGAVNTCHRGRIDGSGPFGEVDEWVMFVIAEDGDLIATPERFTIRKLGLDEAFVA